MARPAARRLTAVLLLAAAAVVADGKLAFLFLTPGPLPIAPVWERFFAPVARDAFNIYVHTPPNITLTVETASSLFVGREIDEAQRLHVRWGRNVWLAEERLFLAAFHADAANDWFFLLSDHCMPIRSFKFMVGSLAWGRRDYMQSWESTHRWKAEFNVPLSSWREGSNWAALRRSSVALFASDEQFLPTLTKLELADQVGFGMDEHWKQTALFNVSMMTWTSPTWTSWPPNGSFHPHSYCMMGAGDVGEPVNYMGGTHRVWLDADRTYLMVRIAQSTHPKDPWPRLFMRKVCAAAAAFIYGFVEALDGDVSYVRKGPLPGAWLTRLVRNDTEPAIP